MAFLIEPAFDAVKGLIASVEGMQKVEEGVPNVLGASIHSFIALAPITFQDVATSLVEIEVTFYIFLGYKVSTDEGVAERRLMNGVADLLLKFLVARENDFGGTLQDASINLELAAQPEYELLAAQEYRRYPVLIRGHIQQSI